VTFPRPAALLAALLAASLLGACATGSKLRETAAVLHSDVEKAKRSGAARCAPRELALAETNVDFADHEIAYGDPVRAKGHLETAEVNVRKALEMSQTCTPTQVTIATGGAVRIEKTDADKDGVADVDDRCPEIPGRPELLGCPDGDGDGIPDLEDRCPKEPGTALDQGCPVAKDTDGDGIPDDIDRCALDPEDKDGFQDEDGCPDADNDGDGIVDRSDACPLEAGSIENRGCAAVDGDGDTLVDTRDRCPTQFGPPALDGCPRKFRYIEATRTQIRLKQQIAFAGGKAKILPASNKVLNEVALAMNDFPRMRVFIEGHTDAVGKPATNLRLSERRADAVLDYLVARGITPDRLESAGLGQTKPIASNKTKTGRAKNRRTEIRVVSLE
jgi:OOP family OmpA-OmpF porin